jgi:predicted RNase H-like HicB family nuclease
MRKLTYLAVLEPSNDGFSVFYPDLPGCISFGSDIEDAQKNAKEALELHIWGMEKDNEALPTPSRVLDANEVKGCIVSAVTIFPDFVRNDMNNSRVKTNVTIPLWLKKEAEKNSVNFSRLLETSLLDYLSIERRN